MAKIWLDVIAEYVDVKRHRICERGCYLKLGNLNLPYDYVIDSVLADPVYFDPIRIRIRP
jgi:hypothetical protein